VGWGQAPYFSEYTPAGALVLDGRFVDSNSSYRAYRFRWNGTPRTSPKVAVSTSGGTTTVYVSWNGATAVEAWRVLAGSSTTGLHAVTTANKQGFETAIAITPQRYVAVQALDSSGRTLATSSTVRAQ
jgi:hypothetical protein